MGTLKDEIAHQGDMITKLGKEKRNCADGRQKTEEDIQAAEDKCNHLSRVKGKLEQALDEAEDALEREKKVKGDIEKSKRKVEGDLKLTQEAVSDLERVKGELQGAAARKDKEGSALAAKIDDEATLGSKYSKQTKELQARLEELDEELAVERGNRSKAEKSRTMLKKDIEDIASRLEEAGSNTATQVELNKKREGELARLKSELEELNIAHEGTLAALRMKHNNTMADLGEQIDSLSANKVKSEKDKANMELDLRDARCDLEDAVKGKAELDKTGKLLQGSIVDANTRLDEMARALNEAESSKKRLQVENQDLSRQIDELEAAIANMNKGKISVTTQLEDTKALADAENKDRSSLLTKYEMFSTDLENLREKLENENARKSDTLKALSKAQAEIQLWKSRYETEGMGRVEELEAARNKLQAKIVESEELVDVLTTKVANAEKSETRMNSELDDLAMEYERVHAAALITEKRGKNFDKVLGEWQSKAADVSAEVAASQDEGRNYTSELLRMRLLSSLILSSARTRTSLTRSRISWISSVRAAAPSTTWTSRGVAWSKRRKSSRELSRRPRAPSSRRRTRSSVPSLSLDRSSRRPRVRLSESRRLWRERSTSLKSVSTMPTRLTPRDLSLSSATRASLRRPSSCTRTRPAPAPRSWSRSASLSARLPPSPESLRSPRPSWTAPSVPSASSRWRLPMAAMPSTTCRLRSMPCSALPRMLRKSPRRRWLTPPVLLMSSALSRTTPLPRPPPSSP